MRNRFIKVVLPAVVAVVLMVGLPLTSCSRGRTGEAVSNGTKMNTAVPCFVSLHQVDAAKMWEITEGNEDIIIAVLDTGIDSSHPLLKGRVVAEVNFSKSDTVTDVNGHGTHIAGIIAAVALRNPIINVKVAEDDGTCWSERVGRGIRWAADQGVRVINISLTFAKPYDALDQAVDYAWAKGAIVVAAAGNTPDTKPSYPAFYPHCIAVTATDDFGEILKFARKGEWVDVSAPGEEIVSALPSDRCGLRTGTSQATAYVSAVASLIADVVFDTNGNGFTNDEVYRIILQRDDANSDRPGLLNGVKFLREAGNYDPAIAEFERAIALNPNNFDAYIRRGFVYMRTLNMDKAVVDFSKAIDINSGSALAWYSRGLAYARMRRFDDAIRDFNRVTEIDPDYIDVYVDRSTAYGSRQAAGDFDLGLADALKAVEIKPDYSQARVALAWSYIWLKDWPRALREATKAVELNPQLGAAYNVRGTVYMELSDYDASIADYTMAMNLEPGSSNISMNRGIVYLKKGMFNEAIADFNKSLELRPNYDLALFNRADAYAQMGESELMVADLNTIITTSTDSARIAEAKARLSDLTRNRVN